jgi:hypothetical protein
MIEVNDALRMMKTEKVVGPNEIPIEVWKCLDDVVVGWLMNLFNKIFSFSKLPSE